MAHVTVPDELARVDVDDRQGLRMLDDEVGPRAEPDLTVQGLLDLVLDAVVLELSMPIQTLR